MEIKKEKQEAAYGVVGGEDPTLNKDLGGDLRKVKRMSKFVSE